MLGLEKKQLLAKSRQKNKLQDTKLLHKTKWSLGESWDVCRRLPVGGGVGVGLRPI